MTYYVSGPMTGYPDFNYPAFEQAAKFLRSKGLLVVSPHELAPESGRAGGQLGGWRAHMREDLAALMDCDALVLLPGWPGSKGARIELSTALGLDIPIYFLDGDLLVEMGR